MRFLNIGILLLVALALTTPARAEINARISAQRISSGQTVDFIISMEGDTSLFPPQIDTSPLEKNFKIIANNVWTTSVWNNGTNISKKEVTFTLSPKVTGELKIPALTIKGEKTQEMSLVVDAAPSSYRISKDPQEKKWEEVAIFAKRVVDEDSPYENAQVIYTLRIYIPSSLPISQAFFNPPTGKDVIVEQMAPIARYETEINNQKLVVLEQKFALFPTRPGKATIEGGTVTLTILVDASLNRTSRGSIDSQTSKYLEKVFGRSMGFLQRDEELTVKAEDIVLDVRPRPEKHNNRPWLPALSLDVKTEGMTGIASRDLPVGEPANLMLRIEAQGLLYNHIPDIQLPRIDGLRIYEGEIRKDNFFGENANSFKEMSFTIIPVKEGRYTLPAIRIPWHNTATGKEEILTIPEIRINAVKEGGSSAMGELQDYSAPDNRDETPNIIYTPQESTPDKDPLTLLYIGIGAGLAAAVAIGGAFLLFMKSRKKRISKNDYERKLKRVKEACFLGNAKLTGDALITWAKANIRNDINSLNGIAKALHDEELAKMLEDLNREIYSGRKDSFDGEKLYRTLEKSLKTRRARLRKIRRKNKIPGLYPFQ